MESLTLKLKLFTCADPELLIRKGGGGRRMVVTRNNINFKVASREGGGSKTYFH